MLIPVVEEESHNEERENGIEISVKIGPLMMSIFLLDFLQQEKDRKTVVS